MEFHHLGLACDDLDRERSAMAVLGYTPEGQVFDDPVQGVSVQFLTGAGPRVELVAPLGDVSSVLASVLQQRLKLYHMAYEVSDLAAVVDSMRARRGKLVVPPSPAVAFEGRLICFLALPNRLLIELISAR
jgi:methylmalonyl-CoA/ethylmalonyl-CoA epimerase